MGVGSNNHPLSIRAAHAEFAMTNNLMQHIQDEVPITAAWENGLLWDPDDEAWAGTGWVSNWCYSARAPYYYSRSTARPPRR